MRGTDLPSIEYLRQALEYRDGKLFWRVRPISHFKNSHECNVWNAKWAGKEAGGQHKNPPRMQVSINCKKYQNSIITWAIVKGRYPGNKDVDHKDRCPMNNNIENLRLASRRQNAWNSSSSKNSCGFKGVHRKRDRFEARINLNGKPVHIGTFMTPEEAHEAYIRVAKKHFGEFACGG